LSAIDYKRSKVMATSRKSAPKKAAKKLTQKAERAAVATRPVNHPGLRFGHKHHVFVAKVKAGEIWALNQLTQAAKEAITPLFEMWPPNPGTATKPAKSVTQHVTDVLESVRLEWGSLPFFLDTRYMPLGGTPSGAQASTVFSIARSKNLLAVPVTALAASPAYQQAIQNVIAADNRGVMIRLTTQDFNNPILLDAYLAALVGILQVARQQVDIALDLEYRSNQLEVQQLGQSLLNSLPTLPDWRTVTLVAGCFPAVSPAQVGTWTQVSRADWMGWSQVLTSQTNAGARVPSYGDYGVRCGGIPVVIPNIPDPNLRYTTQQTILVRKDPKTNGVLQAMCVDLVARAEFAGANFSVGDSLIAARAAMPGLLNNGQAFQWIQWCTNHHLELVAWQIRNLP
jgi:Beta protein